MSIQQVPIRKYTSDFPDDRLGPETTGRAGIMVGQRSELLPVHFLEKGMMVQKPVARIVKPDERYATGFLISKSLFITNNHVFESIDLALESKFEFNYQLGLDNDELKIDSYRAEDSIFYTNDKNKLDFTLIQLEGNPGQKWGSLNIAPFSSAVGDYCNIIQHPLHRHKEVALHDNSITRIHENGYVFYRTDTDEGSSGSPIFDNNWNLIAIHHAFNPETTLVDGSRQYFENEGVILDFIIQDLIKNAPTSLKEILKKEIVSYDII